MPLHVKYSLHKMPLHVKKKYIYIFHILKMFLAHWKYFLHIGNISCMLEMNKEKGISPTVSIPLEHTTHTLVKLNQPRPLRGAYHTSHSSIYTKKKWTHSGMHTMWKILSTLHTNSRIYRYAQTFRSIFTLLMRNKKIRIRPHALGLPKSANAMPTQTEQIIICIYYKHSHNYTVNRFILLCTSTNPFPPKEVRSVGGRCPRCTDSPSPEKDACKCVESARKKLGDISLIHLYPWVNLYSLKVVFTARTH